MSKNDTTTATEAATLTENPFKGFTFWFGPNVCNQHGTVARGAIAFDGDPVAIYKHNLKTDLVTVVTDDGKTKTTQAGGLRAEQVAEMLFREMMVEAKKAA